MKNPIRNKTHRITIRFDKKQYEEIKSMSEETNVKIAKLVRVALNDYQKTMKKKRN